MPAGRPTDYSEEILQKTQEYIESSEDDERKEMIGLSAKGTELYRTKLHVKLPSIEGLAYFLKIHKDTLYEWANIHPEFSDVLNLLRNKQAQALISKGLSSDYNPTIAKLLLSKHGYKEATDVTTDDKPLNFGQLTDEQLNQLINSKIGQDRASVNAPREGEETQGESA